MPSTLRTGLIILLAATPATLVAAVGQPVASPGPAKPAHADYKIAVWYRRDRPLETFRYQIYDVRKGEYSRAVEDWLGVMQSKYTLYVAAVRDVDLAREKGETELLKVGSVIKRDLLAAAAIEGVFLGEPVARAPARQGGLPSRPELGGRPSPLGSANSGRIDLNPPGPSFPMPVPYPRRP
jgi:hypothetical protein